MKKKLNKKTEEEKKEKKKIIIFVEFYLKMFLAGREGEVENENKTRKLKRES